MSVSAKQVIADRETRNIARDAYEGRLAQIKADMEARGIAGRIADEVGEKAKAAFDEAVDIAESHPGVVGGTILALVLWFVRSPMLAWAEDWFGPSERIDDDGDGE
ncbi:hypothetical protein B2G71_18985 [Novosphingobium sp. PC22D]|uniref:hypothetical protein n=1 Tax=Novosphingobium sp. PC22D TaxID=1962403 RepID=UPI000BEFACD7|nr:hypothetical protein [Novosphingobium sp. PC22D]PEQ11124.1 hypothetical protein B2G71_18985 [Novosphingobium sp. PC22D]